MIGPGLRACHLTTKLQKNRENFSNNVTWKIALRLCNNCFARTGSSSTLNKIANHTYKARADWLNHFYSLQDSQGYKVRSQNGQLRLSWNRIWASLGAVIITEQKPTAVHENQSIRGHYKMKSDRIYLRVAASWAWLRLAYHKIVIVLQALYSGPFASYVPIGSERRITLWMDPLVLRWYQLGIVWGTYTHIWRMLSAQNPDARNK